MKIRVAFAVLTAALTLVCQTFAADKPKAAAASTNKAASVAAPAPVTDVVVARVNGTEIKRKELDVAVQGFAAQMARRGRPVQPSQSAVLEQDVLEELIGRELLLQEGSKHLPADIDKKTQEQAEQMKAQAGGEEEFKKTLAESGITAEEYVHRVRDNVIIHEAIQSAIDKEVKISPDEVKAFYDKNPDQFKQPETVRASHILIRCPPDAPDDVKKAKRAQIDAARSLVKTGDKFAEVAKKVSEDPGSAVNGGDLGYFARGQMVPEFDAVAFSLKTNEVSDVITTQFGYHVLLVTGRKPAQTVPFDEVKDELGKFLKQRKGNDVTRNQVAELRKAGKVEVLLTAPVPAFVPSVETAPMKAPSK
jgi:peptidyl-prolyl cis-trans isomerase C